MMREPLVLFQWGVSSYFGWGVYGLNLLLAWADRTDLLPASLLPIDPAALDLDPLERLRIAPALRRSAEVQAELARAAGRTATTSRLVLDVVQNGLAPARVAHGVVLRGTPSLGVAFVEDTAFSPEARARLAAYPLVVAGSSWAQGVLEAAGAPNVATVLQGVDTSHFHPAPRRDLFPGRFVVFSGGKLEYRKGQDLVLRAFRLFAARHEDALLLTAWGSPWGGLGIGLASGDLLPPPMQGGEVDVAGWTRANGLADHQVVHCGAVPNRAMARIMREADVAVFPNRAEAGTNLVAMECVACGVLTLLSATTGHLDLLRGGAAAGLHRQAAISGASHVGWGDSDVEEILAALETAYEDPGGAGCRVREGASRVGELTWARQTSRLAELVLPYMSAPSWV